MSNWLREGKVVKGSEADRNLRTVHVLVSRDKMIVVAVCLNSFILYLPDISFLNISYFML